MKEKQYTEADIDKAIRAVKKGVAERKAARDNGVPRSTLKSRLKGTQPVRQAQEPFQRLSPTQEKGLADWILLQASLGLAPTHAEIRFFAQEILRISGDSQPLGKRWVQHFLARYPEIGVGRGRRIESARAKGATTEVIQKWWQYLLIPEVAGIKPQNIWNADEGGLQEGKTGNGLVLGLKGVRPLQRKEPGSRVWTSFIECISANGTYLPPLIIFKGRHVQEQWFPTDLTHFQGWEFTATENGWTSDRTALEWLQTIFLPATQPSTPQRRLLILDGHGSHVTKEFMSLCHLNNVFILYLPPHTSHVLQPLDLSVFSPLKEAYRRKIDSQALFTCSTVVGKRQFLQSYAYARAKALTTVIIKSGWRASGLWPRNMAKPLMNRLLVENANKDNSELQIRQFAEENRAQKRTQALSELSQVPWETPKRTRELATQINTFSTQIPSTTTTRLFFQKVRKGYEARDFELATAQQKIKSLEAKLEALEPRKKRRVVADPNQTFVNIRRIAATRNENEEEIQVPSERAEDSDQESIRSCILIN